MNAPWAFAVGLAIVFAGCLGAGEAPAVRVDAVDRSLPVLALGDGSVYANGAEALIWNGSELSAGESERATIALALPEGFWEANDGFVEFAVRWALFEPYQMSLRVTDAASGKLLGEGKSPHAFVGAQGTGLPVLGSVSVLLLERAPAGVYEVEATVTEGSGAYVGIVQVEATPKPGDHEAVRDLLPNLVTLPPRDLGIRAPEVDPPVGTKGCRADEIVFGVITRCLRFSNGIGNKGEGPLELFLPAVEGAKGVASTGTFTQRIHTSDGAFRDEPIGRAVFHPQHAHFHYQDSAVFELYAYDVETMTRGEKVVEGRKTGFCFADLDVVENDLLHSTYPRFDGTACWDPTIAGGQWSTGLNPTWYDRYHWSWFEQYVDVTNVGDGVYELVSTANVGGGLRESDPSDNVNSVVFGMVGDEVTELLVPEK